MPDPVRVYWDSNVFLYRIARRPDCIGILEQWTERAERGEVEIVTSAFTLCEVAKVEGEPLPEEQERKIVDFFENPYILVRQVDRFVAALSREVVRTYNIPPKDAVHVASAVLSGVSAMHTYDGKHLLKKTGLIGDPPLTIEKPNWKDGQPPLLEGPEVKPAPQKRRKRMIELDEP